MLNGLGSSAGEFIEYACNEASTVNKKDYYSCHLGDHIEKGVIVSFQDFIRAVYKYTTKMKSAVALDAKIVSTGINGLHYIFFWGIRDVGLREGHGAKKLPLYQRGYWSCVLEDALMYGILPEQIEHFRENLCLTVKDKIFDKEFFQLMPEDVVI